MAATTAQTLVENLRKTFAPDQTLIRQAEEYLKGLETASGYVVVLLQVMLASDQLELATRQAASIQFKNVVRRMWTAEPPNTMSDADKTFVRSHILEAMSRAERLVRKQLSVTVCDVAFSDFASGGWPELLPRIVAMLTTAGAHDFNTILAGLSALRAVAKNFEFCARFDDQTALALNAVVDQTFPALEALLAAAAKAPGGFTAQTLVVERTALKIFLAVTNTTLPNYMTRSQGAVERWLGFTVSVVARAAAPAMAVSAALQRDWWACVHRATEVLLRWLLRFGNPEDTRGKKALRVAMLPWQRTIAPNATSAFVALLASCKQCQAPEREVYSALTFLGNSTRYPLAYASLKPHAFDLVQHVAFPLLCASPEDFALADNDPTEYLRREFECSSSFFSTRVGAINFIGDLVKFRPKYTLLPIMQFISRIFQESAVAGAESNAESIVRKFGCMVLVTAIDGKLKHTDPYAAQLELMVRTFIVPELDSPHTIMRAMACWTFARYSDIDWTDGGALFTAALQRTVQLASDQSHLVVSVFAALSLKHLVQIKLGADLLRPHLNAVFDIYYRFIDRSDLDLDDLVMALEVFVEIYGEAIAPHAFGICKHLAEAYMSIVTALVTAAESGVAAVASEEEEENLILKASSCLETLSTIITAVHAIPELFCPLARALLPVLTYTISQERLSADFLGDALNLAQLVTFWTPPPMPTEYWQLFPLIAKSFDSYGEDFIADMLAPLDNFISRGTEVFLADPGNMQLIFGMLRKSIGTPTFDEVDCLKACQLAEVVIHFCKGRTTDEYVAAVVQLALERLKVARLTGLKVLLIELAANALYYNPQLALQALTATPGNLELVFATWHKLRDQFVRPYDKKISILGLTSIFLIPVDSLPPVIRSNLPAIIGDILYYLRELDIQIKAIAKEERKLKAREEARKAGRPMPKDSEDEDEDDVEDDGLAVDSDEEAAEMARQDEHRADHGLDSDEELAGDDDGAGEEDLDGDEDEDAVGSRRETLESLAAQAQEIRECEEDNLDEFLDLDDEDFETPLNLVDEVTFFVMTAQAAVEGQNRSEIYRTTFTTLPLKQQKQIQKWINLARERQNERLAHQQ